MAVKIVSVVNAKLGKVSYRLQAQVTASTFEYASAKLIDAQRYPRYRTLDQVDQDLRASSYRQNDLLLLRFPDFSDQDLTDMTDLFLTELV